MQRHSTLLFILLAALMSPLNGSIIKKPPAKPTEVLYKDLVCTDQDKENIFEIINTMFENSKLSLLFKQTHMKELGAQVNHVHPLKFLGVVFSNPHLKSCMAYIWGDYFKRNGFMDGLGPSLDRERERDKLEQHIGDFAKEVGVTVENVRPYFDTYDWENLVLYLIHS